MSILNFLFKAPASDWNHFVIFLLGIVVFILIAEKTRSWLGWSPEINRKLVHVLTGLLIFFSPFFFNSGKPLIWMAVLFAAVDLIGVETGKLKGMHGTSRKSFGTVFYPLTFLILVLTCWNGRKSVLLLSMLILALADAAAAIAGENLDRPHEYVLWKDKKSAEGSGVMFVVSFLVVWILLPQLSKMDSMSVGRWTAAWIALLSALVAAALEALSANGSDNLTAPLGAAFVMNFMLSSPTEYSLRLTIGLALGLMIAVLSFRLRFLSASGCAAAFILSAGLFGIGGWPWTVPILVFFISSSLLSKTGKNRKKKLAGVFEKTDKRDLGQVLANGGTAGFLVILSHYFPNPVWYAMYLGAVAAVNADTWATEIGVFADEKPVSIIGFRPVSMGTSGGITRLGTLGAFLGSLIIAAAGWFFPPPDAAFLLFDWVLAVVVLAGFLGSIADSILGATVQAQYRCPVCGKITEKRKHCQGRLTRLVSGIRFVNNDWVNWICSIAGAAAVWTAMRF